jgi:hypothetical protein
MTTKRKAASARGKKSPNPWKDIPKLSPDDPLFKRGWIIGQRRYHGEPTPGLHLFNASPSCSWSLDEEAPDPHPRQQANEEWEREAAKELLEERKQAEDS